MGDLEPKSLNTSLAWPDAVLELQTLLADTGASTFIVGGAVRDAYLRRPIKDIDLATSGSGLELARTIANRRGGAYYPLDAEREVGRALIDSPEGRLIFDVARFRGEDLRADLTDRDFTINAMAVNLQGDLNLVIDPLGGADDLKAKILRRCSARSLPNDPLRVLRAVRQSVQFALRIEAETLRDVRTVVERLTEVSVERVRDELFRMLALVRPATALRVAHSVGLLSMIFPEIGTLEHDAWQQTLATIERLNEIFAIISPVRTDETAAQFSLGMLVVGLDQFRRQLYAHCEMHWADERPHRGLMMLAALLAPFGREVAERRATDFHLSNDEKERLTAIVRHEDAFATLSDLDPTAIYRFWKLTGTAGVDVILMYLARYLGKAGIDFDQDAWLRQVEHAQMLLDAYFVQRERFVEPPALVNGDDLMRELGLPRSRKIGELLEIIRESQVRGEVMSVEDALNTARAHLNNHHF